MALVAVNAPAAIQPVLVALRRGILSHGKGSIMGDETKAPGNLPGNKGQFGANNATEDYKSLADHDGGDASAPRPAPQGTESDEANPGPHQVHGGMRS